MGILLTSAHLLFVFYLFCLATEVPLLAHQDSPVSHFPFLAIIKQAMAVTDLSAEQLFFLILQNKGSNFSSGCRVLDVMPSTHLDTGVHKLFDHISLSAQ